ncbi:MAG: PKD domain-containing protein, partial [Bacteroidia bacterium]
IYIYNTDLNGGAGGFATYINGISSPAVGSGGVGNTIPMSQAFYVHSTGATALNAQESVKVAGNPTYLKTNSTNNTSPFVRINLKNATGYNDETVLYTQAGATQLFDDAFDAYKMRGQDPSAPSIALEKANKQFQVNGVAPITGNFSIDLKTLTGYTGIYTLSASGFSTFPAGACISLFDKFTNITTNIKTTDYVFNLSDTTTVARFNLNITINPLTVNASVTQPVCQALNSGKIIASAPTAGPWNYYWTSNGSAVKTSLNKASADTLDNLSGGIYDLEMSTVGMCDDGNYSYQVISQQSVVASFTSADTIHLGVSPLMAFTNLSSSAVAYSWNFGNGLGTSTTASPVYLYSTPGTYTVQLISWSSTGCSDTAYKIITVVGTDVGIKSNGVNTSQLIIKTIGDNEFVFEQAFTQEQSLTFRLNDMQGRLVKDYGTITSKNLILPVDLKNLSAGIYLMRITFGTDQKVIKLPVK